MIETKEGPRGFAVLIQQIDEGCLHAEMSEAIQQACGDLQLLAEHMEKDAKGTVSLTLSFEVSRVGTVRVRGEVKAKTPKMRPAQSVFWLTKGNNLSPENPRQQKLPLREVPVTPEKLRDLPDAAPMRTV
jgi:hypothetical protein